MPDAEDMIGGSPWSNNQPDPIVVIASADMPNPPNMTLQEQRVAMAAATELLREKYDAGVPFFTKDVIRSVVEQLDNGNETVAIKGLDGRDVHFTVGTGKLHPFFRPEENKICVITKPMLSYKTTGHLLSVQDPENYPVCSAYLPVRLAHSTEIRNAHTEELLPPFRVLDATMAMLRFEQSRQAWNRSWTFVQLKSTLSSAAVPPGIDKVVALACSPFSWAEWVYPSMGMVHHALALVLRDFLAARDPTHEIRCSAQDPLYTPVDEQVLSEAGFTVVDDPRAFLEVDEASVLVCWSPDIPVKQIVADLARPALIIWNRVDREDLDKDCPDPVSTRVLRMMEEYVELPFLSDNGYFASMAIYVRKAQ